MILAILLAAAIPISDWQPLFEQLPEGIRGWRLENGALRTIPGFKTEDLFTRLRYRNFEFEVEYRVAPGGNSGIRYLPLPGRTAGAERAAALCGGLAVLLTVALRRRRWAALGAMLVCGGAFLLVWQALARHPLALEFQVLDNDGHADGRRGALYRAGALYGLSPAMEDSSRKAGEWNHARVAVCGNRIGHWLNGRQVVEADLGSSDLARARESFFSAGWRRIYSESEWRKLGLERPSTVGLQHHGEEVWFKSPRIRELSCE
jgi:hypothetical protein